MPFFRSIDFTGLLGAAVEGVVTGHGLARTCRGEHGEEEREVFHLWQNLFDAQQGDHRLGQGGSEAGVAFVFRERDHARLGDGEVRACDADVRLDVFLPQGAAGDHREFFRLPGGGAAEFLLEEIADVIAREVHRGEHDVIRRFLAELHDVFTEVALHDFKARLFHRAVQMDLFGGHGLGLDDALGFLVRDDLDDGVACLIRSAAPVDFGATGFEFVGEFREILVEVVDGFPLGLGGGLAGGLPITEGGLLLIARHFVFPERGLDEAAMTEVLGDDARLIEKFLRLGTHGLCGLGQGARTVNKVILGVMYLRLPTGLAQPGG